MALPDLYHTTKASSCNVRIDTLHCSAREVGSKGSYSHTLVLPIITHNYKLHKASVYAISYLFCLMLVQMVVGYADLMQQFSLVDSAQAEYVRKQTDAAAAEINAGNYVAAFKVHLWYYTTSLKLLYFL